MIHHIEFQSLQAVADAAEKTGHEAARNNEWEFSNCTFEDALRMAREGWPEGAEKIRGLLRDLDLPPIRESVHSATRNDVTGSYVDVGEYVQGSPECMVNFMEDSRRARFAHIVVSAGFNCQVSPAQAMQRGLMIAAVIDSLEARGVRCDVDLLRACTGKNGAISYITLLLKRAADPMDLDTLAFGVAHPGYHRRLMFAIMEIQSKAYRTAFGVPNRGYGRSVTPPNPPDGCILFPTPEGHEDWSEKAARAKVEAILKEFSEGKESTQGQ